MRVHHCGLLVAVQPPLATPRKGSQRLAAGTQGTLAIGRTQQCERRLYWDHCNCHYKSRQAESAWTHLKLGLVPLTHLQQCQQG